MVIVIICAICATVLFGLVTALFYPCDCPHCTNQPNHEKEDPR